MNEQRPASDSDRSLSGALIGGAFGFIGIAIFASASYADKVERTALWWGNFIATLSVLALLASIMCGGWGWTRKAAAGTGNPFNLQAIAGILGVALLLGAASVFAFSPKEETPDPVRTYARLDALEARAARQQAQLNLLLSRAPVLQQRDAPNAAHR